MDGISVEKLTNGEFVALGAIEVVSVPHISIVSPDAKDENVIVERYKNEMTELLNEVYQIYKESGGGQSLCKDVSLELLWSTHAVKNQSYNAEIRLFIIVRCIDREREEAIRLVSEILKLFRITLWAQRYEIRDTDYATLSSELNNVRDLAIQAIVKEEKVANLQNAILPYCYSFDRILSAIRSGRSTGRRNPFSPSVTTSVTPSPSVPMTRHP